LLGRAILRRTEVTHDEETLETDAHTRCRVGSCVHRSHHLVRADAAAERRNPSVLDSHQRRYGRRLLGRLLGEGVSADQVAGQRRFGTRRLTTLGGSILYAAFIVHRLFGGLEKFRQRETVRTRVISRESRGQHAAQRDMVTQIARTAAMAADRSNTSGINCSISAA